ncbi:MAG: uracil phosphoribosyltransferase [Bacteroidetes bacterium]|nr:uracil phosphoribosyltransferase [Bacteroidota bacterium]
MTWKGFFEGIQSFFENFAFAPYDALRNIAPESWVLSNMVSWLIIATGFCGFFYWMAILYKVNVSGEEDRSSTSHSFLG